MLLYLCTAPNFNSISMSRALQSKDNNTTDRVPFTPEHSSSVYYRHHINNLNRKLPVYNFQSERAIDNQDVQTLMNSTYAVEFDFSKIGILQPKLKLSQPGDEYEQEADRVAEQVMRNSLSDSTLPKTTPKEEGVDRQCFDCDMEEEEDEDEEMEISRKPSATSDLQISNRVTNEIKDVVSRGGSPLDANTKAFMESRFGFDFSNVKIHTDETAARSSNLVNALAYTIGNAIVFAQGQYQPNTSIGRSLLAHELTHVIQQRSRKSGDVSSLQRSSKEGETESRQREVSLSKKVQSWTKGATIIADDDIATRRYLGIPRNEPAADTLVRRPNGDFDIADSKGSAPRTFVTQAENTYKYLQKKHPKVRVRFWMGVKNTANLNNLGNSGYSAPNGILLDPSNGRPVRIAGHAVTVTGGQKVPPQTPPQTPSARGGPGAPQGPKAQTTVVGPTTGPSPSWMTRGVQIAGVAGTAVAVIGSLRLGLEFSDSRKLTASLRSGIYFEKFWNEIKKHPNGTRILNREQPVSGLLGMTVLKSVPVSGTIVHNESFNGIVWDDGVIYQSTFDNRDGFGIILTEPGGRPVLINKKGVDGGKKYGPLEEA
jgi:hypothetical protein